MIGITHDQIFKEIFSDERILREFIEIALPELHRKGIISIERENIELPSVVFGKRQTDLLFKVSYKGGQAYLFLLLEHQTKVDQLMPLRVNDNPGGLLRGIEELDGAAELQGEG